MCFATRIDSGGTSSLRTTELCPALPWRTCQVLGHPEQSALSDPHTRRQVTHRHVQSPNRRHTKRFGPSCAASRHCARVMGGIAWSGVSRPAHCLAASVQRVHCSMIERRIHCWRLVSNKTCTHNFDWTRLESQHIPPTELGQASPCS